LWQAVPWDRLIFENDWKQSKKKSEIAADSSSVCEDFWMVGRGKVGPFDGDLDDYQRYLLEESRRLREEARKAEQAAAATSKAEAQMEPAAPAVEAPVATALAPAPAAPPTPPAASAGDQREQRRLAALARQQMAEKTRPFKKELEQLDKRLPQLQAERTRLEGLLSQPISPAEMAEAGRSLKTCNDEIDSLEERWLELSEQIEQLSAAISD
jgi:ATP-binding cassette subfamily F protein 3